MVPHREEVESSYYAATATATSTTSTTTADDAGTPAASIDRFVAGSQTPRPSRPLPPLSERFRDLISRDANLDIEYTLIPVFAAAQYGIRSEVLHQRLRYLREDLYPYYLKHVNPSTTLNFSEFAAIHIYTAELQGDSVYRAMNKTLRENNRASVDIFIPYIFLLLKGLQKCPVYRQAPGVYGTVYRAVAEDVSGQYHHDRTEWTWYDFASTTSKLDVTERFLEEKLRDAGGAACHVGTIFCCRMVGDISEFEDENEVILPLNTRLKYVSKIKLDRYWLIQLLEQRCTDVIIRLDDKGDFGADDAAMKPPPVTLTVPVPPPPISASKSSVAVAPTGVIHASTSAPPFVRHAPLETARLKQDGTSETAAVMHAGHRKPLSEYTADEVGKSVQLLGFAYASYCQVFIDNGLSGPVLDQFDDEAELVSALSDIGVSKKFHLKALATHILGLRSAAGTEAPINSDTTSKSHGAIKQEISPQVSVTAAVEGVTRNETTKVRLLACLLIATKSCQ
jgi:NAD:arginine ADP-ribosyltransferase